MKTCFLILLFSFSTPCVAENYISLFGGGGEPAAKPTTIFDGSLDKFGEFTAANAGKWKYTISFNGGHADTDKKMQTLFTDAQSKQDFKPDSMQLAVKAYLEKIESGQITSKDQLVIMINTHGGEKTDASETHLLTAGASKEQIDLRNLKGATGLVNMDDLKKLTEAANRKGIKLAIIDFSCHSGNSLSLANDKTCVISSTGPNHYSYPNFASDFISQMKSGKTLEQVYLDTRRENKDNAYPMISSPAGRETTSQLYSALTPFSYTDGSAEQGGNRLSEYIENAAAKPQICDPNEHLSSFNKQLAHLRAVLGSEKDPAIEAEIKILSDLVNERSKKIKEKVEIAKRLGAKEFLASEKTKISAVGVYNAKRVPLDHSFTLKDLLETNFDRIIASQEDEAQRKILKAIAPGGGRQYDEEIAQYNASADLHKQAKAKQQELIAKYPNLKKYRENFRDAMADLSKDSASYYEAAKIAAQERKIYEMIYKKSAENNKSKPNPCSEIVM